MQHEARSGPSVLALDGPAVAVIPGTVSGPGTRAAADPLTFHATIPGYAATRLQAAPAAAAALGVGEVLVKVETERFGLPAFKVLGASWAIYRALLQRLGRSPADLESFAELQAAAAALRPLSLVAATDGNHGRAVAHVAALLGLESAVYVPAGTAAARIDAIRGEGAKVTVVDGGYDAAVARSARDAADRRLVISDTSWEGYEEVPGWVIEGYRTIFTELAGQLTGPVDLVVVQMGVGALAAAAVRHFWTAGPRPRLVGMEPASAACVLESVAAGHVISLDHPQTSVMAGLNCATPSVVAWPDVSRGIDVYVAIPDAGVGKAMRVLARDRIIAGETGAGGLAAMLTIANPRDPQAARVRDAIGLSATSRVLLLCTEGATDPDAYARLTGPGPSSAANQSSSSDPGA